MAHAIVRLTAAGAAQIPNGHEGMTFPVHGQADGRLDLVVRDYRFPQEDSLFSVFLLERQDFEWVD